jgi:uncharacterized metal-binding protein
METKTCCSNSGKQEITNEFEIVHIEKTKTTCKLCEDFTASKLSNPDLTAVISCEGACLRGEVSRRVANELCFNKIPQNTARVCLGSAFTKDTGQRNMVRNSKRVIILEGCAIKCASRMMKGVLPELNPEIVYIDRYYDFNKNLFRINEVSEEELVSYSNQAADNILYEIINEKLKAEKRS